MRRAARRTSYNRRSGCFNLQMAENFAEWIKERENVLNTRRKSILIGALVTTALTLPFACIRAGQTGAAPPISSGAAAAPSNPTTVARAAAAAPAHDIDPDAMKILQRAATTYQNLSSYQF